MTMNPANVSYLYNVCVNGSVNEVLLVVVPKSHRVKVRNTSHIGYTTRIRYIGQDSPSQTGQLRFTIYNVTVQDAGTYYCQGSRKQIVLGCRQILVVLQKPTTPSITGPASAVSGENVTLTCSSSRSLPLDHPQLAMTYTWRRNRTLLESGDGSDTGGDVLTITHISRENQGDIYTCQAVEEGLESDWSHGHVLEVHYGPDQIKFNGASDRLKAEEGDPLTVRCSAECNPACTVTWWDTSRQRVIPGQREAVLYIPAVDRSVPGQYTCHVNNTQGNKSRILTLEDFYGPDQIKFNDASDRLKADEGDPLTVRCSAECNPACTVTWWDTSGQRVITGQREAVLYIPAVDRSVSGQYTCHVNNTYGNISRNLTLEDFCKTPTTLLVIDRICNIYLDNSCNNQFHFIIHFNFL
ncbi:neural cell adhesion molecule 2-like [Haliotis rufescens]|uniref:neural cell adhesion molecule 2-like n=1 Tax=Haliotis rufescens TaxID=6454 RepID=UPI00201FAF41|nr:neural cell adhesion molecule 2-like [Haliotis rufescens]